MSRVSKKLSKEQKQIAIDNGIPITTVYYRINHGWNIKKAITVKPQKTPRNQARNKLGEFQKVAGRKREFEFLARLDEILDEAIENSGVTPQQWIRFALLEKLKKEGKISEEEFQESLA